MCMKAAVRCCCFCFATTSTATNTWISVLRPQLQVQRRTLNLCFPLLYVHGFHRCTCLSSASAKMDTMSAKTQIQAAAAEEVLPLADKIDHVMEMFGDARNDQYYWLRDDSRSNPKVISHLQRENQYTDSIMSDTKQLQDELYKEIRGRIQEADTTVPLRKGPYFYYQKTLEGKQYKQHCRRLIPDGEGSGSVDEVMPTGTEDPVEEVLLDENSEAEKHEYYSIGAFKVSPNHRMLAYAEDTKGDEIYTVKIVDAESKSIIDQSLKGVSDDLYWIDNETLMYITLDDVHRPFKVWRHNVGSHQSDDVCLYHEMDDEYSLMLQKSESDEYMFVVSSSKTTQFVLFLRVSDPQKELSYLTKRVEGIDTDASHRGNHFFIKRRSVEIFNSELLVCPVDDVTATTVLLPHRPRSWEVSTKRAERKWATAADGTCVPISIVYRKDLVKLDGTDPLLLYGYGSYEICIEPAFTARRLSLLDRGFVFAIAHVRGGGEMGRQWYEDGKLLKKRNTFTDFIACAEYLLSHKFCSEEKICIHGRSAGGLLMGTVLNMRPDLFKSAVAGVPFVDVVTTMLDPTIPLTTSEWEEWGDPRKEEFYFYMKSYSPVDNIQSQNYPHILVTAGLNDPRVLYSEPAKYVAKLREKKTDKNMLLFKCEMGAGHFSKSGRFDRLEEDAFTYAFILKSLDMLPNLEDK